MINTQLTLAELNILIRDTLDNTFSGLIWVKAEIGEMSINRTGHCYLDLVDVDPDTNEVRARARATIWSYSFRMLKPYFESTTGRAFSGGLKILVSAKVEFHVVYGLSLNIRDIDPAYTMGDMALKRREIIQQLKQEGVIEMNKELTLPVVPQRIAVISSPTAAGFQDFMSQLSHNSYRIRFYTKLFPAIMQGTETASSIVMALEQIFHYEDFFDVVVIIRGGGAQLDLAGFDNYELAFNVAQFPIPVITGIGHDKDETVVDMVAHTKLKTPTAVAEFLISGAIAFEQKLTELESHFHDLLNARLEKEDKWLQQVCRQLKQDVRQLVKEKEFRIKLTTVHLNNSIPSFLQPQAGRFLKYRRQLQVAGLGKITERLHFLEKKADSLQFFAKRFIERNVSFLSIITHGLKNRFKGKIGLQQNKLYTCEEKIRLVDPYQVLKRGYSLTYNNGKLLKSVIGLEKGGQLTTRLVDGEIQSKIYN